MKRWALAIGCLLLVGGTQVASADVQVINGKKYECRDGVCMLVEDGEKGESGERGGKGERVAQGYMSADEFVAFLEKREANSLGNAGIWLTLLLVLLGGLAMNLTPCVLPMIPINLIVIGRSAKRGAAYGVGIALAYGALGVAAAVGGLAFGDIQGSPWFNAAVAVVFVGLALALLDVWFLDLSRFRRMGLARTGADGEAGGLPFAFFMGALSAVLAGACVAPVLISVLLLTAKLYAEGHAVAIGLPFVLGLGMALPWPFVGAGLQVLPKPGAWMKWVNRIFGVIVLGFAFYYGSLAVRTWLNDRTGDSSGGQPLQSITPAEFRLENHARPLLVDCWATWCKNCAAMEKVLSEPKVRAALKPYAVLKLQAEDIGELRKLKGFETIKGLPAFVVFE